MAENTMTRNWSLRDKENVSSYSYLQYLTPEYQVWTFNRPREHVAPVSSSPNPSASVIHPDPLLATAPSRRRGADPFQ